MVLTKLLPCSLKTQLVRKISDLQPVARIEGMQELNIGHAIIARSLFVGLERAVRAMKDLIRDCRNPALGPTRGFDRALRADGIRIIAEVKRASPSNWPKS